MKQRRRIGVHAPRGGEIISRETHIAPKPMYHHLENNGAGIWRRQRGFPIFLWQKCWRNRGVPTAGFAAGWRSDGQWPWKARKWGITALYIAAAGGGEEILRGVIVRLALARAEKAAAWNWAASSCVGSRASAGGAAWRGGGEQSTRHVRGRCGAASADRGIGALT